MGGDISRQDIEMFFAGSDPMERIVKIECGPHDSHATVIYRDKDGIKRAITEPFKPFCWMSAKGEAMMFGGDMDKLKASLSIHGITRTELKTAGNDGKPIKRMEDGYRILYQAQKAMCYSEFVAFFEKAAGNGIFSNKGNDAVWLSMSPVEQYMTHSGKRLYKGVDDYEDLVRMSWICEKEGGDPLKHAIQRIAVITNKGFSKVINAKGDNGEVEAVKEFLSTIKDILPDVITGYGNEGAEADFIEKRLETLGTSIKEISSWIFKHPVYRMKRKSILKIGSDMEYYNRLVVWGIGITDCLHAIRRAQTQDTSMRECGMEYVSDHAKTGDSTVFRIHKSKTDEIRKDGRRVYKIAKAPFYVTANEKEDILLLTGEEAANAILLEKLKIIDRTELVYNRSNFLVGKMITEPFERTCTMGTAALWKSVMLTWSHNNGLAIPVPSKDRSITGGMSKIFKVGFVKNVVKYDYNSMYPTIALTYNIRLSTDVLNAMPSMLEYILGEREMYKGLMKAYSSNAERIAERMRKSGTKDSVSETELRNNEALASKYATLQSPFKVFAVSWFGGISSDMFPWNEPDAGEEITCIGRQMFRLLIAHFERKLGYEAIVGATDGINFKAPERLRYSEENPYISNGKGRNSTKGKAYTGFEADIREFEDTYLSGRISIDIDELAVSSINFKRNNYANLLPNGKIRAVGNTLKAKNTLPYISEFLEKGTRILLEGDGKGFVELYYNLIDRLYNYHVPPEKLATASEITMTEQEYGIYVKSGGKRIAAYEIARRNGIQISPGEVIYHVNTGDSPSKEDIETENLYYYDNGDGNGLSDKTQTFKSEYRRARTDYRKNGSQKYRDLGVIDSDGYMVEFDKYMAIVHPEATVVDNVTLNCEIVHKEVISGEKKSEPLEYNADKYIEILNSKALPLFVCFSPSVRDIEGSGSPASAMMIKRPQDRRFFTETECEPCKGYPFSKSEQDNTDDVMKMDDKEIKFWLSIGKKPPYTQECGIEWNG